MSTSDQMNLVRLDVRTPDAATEIFVIDGRFRLVDRGLGYLRTQLEPGLYKVKIRAGFMTQEECIILPEGSGEVVKEFPGIKFSSAAPLANTARADAIHVIAAETESRRIHVERGQGSWIFFFVREWNAPSQSTDSKEGYLHPARGLILKDLQGNVVVDLFRESHHESARNPWAACNVQVDPGSYRLSLDTSLGTVEQTIIATTGWQTQVFLLLQMDDVGPGNRFADLLKASIFLSQPPGFDASDSDLRLVELMRLGLMNERQLLTDDLRKMLREKIKKPMLGIYGAHHLLLSEAPDFELLQVVIANLRDMLGIHPDVEALALLLEANDSAYAFTIPPMLRRSWSIIIDATVKKPELVPLGSLASSAAFRIWGGEPWLLWRAFPQEKEIHPLSSTPSAAGTDYPEVALGSEAFLNSLRELLLTLGQPSGVSPAHAQMSLMARSVPLAEDMIEYLVQILGIPRTNVDDLLKTIASRQALTLRTEVQENSPAPIMLGRTSLSLYQEKSLSEEINEILEQCEAYIRNAAQTAVATSPSSSEIEVDELVQRCRIRLWQSTRERGVSDLRESWERTLEHRTPNLVTQIRRIIDRESIDVFGKRKLSPALSTGDFGYESELRISASGERVSDPQEEIEQRETFDERLTAVTQAIAQLPNRQRTAMIIHLKDKLDETLLKAAFEKQGVDIDTIQWPETRVEAQRLKASLSVARKKLRSVIET